MKEKIGGIIGMSIMLYLMIIIISLLVIGFVVAVKYADKATAVQDFNSYKAGREQAINDVASSITYTTDKECEIMYDTESVDCTICFDYVMGGVTKNVCLSVSETSSEVEDDNKVKEYVKQTIREQIPLTKYSYTARVLKDKIVK